MIYNVQVGIFSNLIALEVKDSLTTTEFRWQDLV